jgi:hypothetical protein
LRCQHGTFPFSPLVADARTEVDPHPTYGPRKRVAANRHLLGDAIEIDTNVEATLQRHKLKRPWHPAFDALDTVDEQGSVPPPPGRSKS